MDGVLAVNKPQGITSFDVIRSIRKTLNIQKIGHAGTLDPLATGVLIVLLGDATKLSNYMMSEVKTYEFDVVFGVYTDTEDITGRILLEEEVNNITDDKIDEVLTTMVGKVKQVPPMYSAIKINGKKLYEYAREGLEIDRQEREIEVFDIERLGNVESKGTKQSVKFKATVSKGTYIRTLSTQIGERLGHLSCMVTLNRTSSGNINLNDCFSLDDIKKGEFTLLDMVTSTKKFNQIEVDDYLENKVLHGMKIAFKDVPSKDELIFFIKDNKLLGIYKRSDVCYKAERVWN